MPSDPRTEAGKRLVEALGEHAPWFVGGSASAELEYVLNIEAEARATLLDELRGEVEEEAVKACDCFDTECKACRGFNRLLALLDDHKKGAAR